MSEEILKALMQLFAIIAKQDEGVESNEREYVKNFLTQQLNDEAVPEYLALFDEKAGFTGEKSEKSGNEKVKLTSVKDSVRILGICKKINKTLTQKQKVIVLVRLFELVNADRKFSEQRMAIINTVAEVFKLTKEEFLSIESFVINNDLAELDNSSNLIINDQEDQCKNAKHVKVEALDGNIFILQVKSVDLYFMRYNGQEDIFLNGLPVNNKRIYLFANGGTIKLPKGKPIYYSDILAHYLADSTSTKISYSAKNINYVFPSGDVGLRNINFSEDQGKLIGLMGASGAGKTTLLNVLAGLNNPTSGQILINGIDLHAEKEKLEGVIGYIPQDDLLIEELTVFQNLYYNAKLCFNDKSEEEIVELVNKTLNNLGLYDRKDLKVGTPLNKMISGGQRKRLNIALELIREPSILFVDEPTSGLSSRDSENVMDLLRELALKGKLIFVVIHQPSSDIYKMFDHMMILDTGGYMIYYGNPVEGVMYFKRLDAQINSDVGECPTCGNVNPELIFNIIEAKVVDEYGRYTPKRKISPPKWEENFKEQIKLRVVEPVDVPPPSNLSIPSWFKQLKIYTIRDFLSKISNKQYIALNLLEAPVLGFILSYIIRYIADPTSNIYIFRENENIPIYIFMALIVALFLGLTVSAEEIFRDRKILKREAFLNLSKSSYLISKILILFSISAIQSILFVLIANNILGIKGMTFEYWIALFTTAAFANMLGLNVSASFNSAVTIYILIPLLMIPMMILSGAMFPFDKLNRSIGSVKKVPLIAEIMPTKWSYEALMVNQFKNNEFERNFYEIEKRESNADFKQVYYIPELEKRIEYIENNWYKMNEDPEVRKEISGHLKLLQNEIGKEEVRTGLDFESLHQLDTTSFNEIILNKTWDYLERLNAYYSMQFQKANNEKENIIRYLLNTNPDLYRNKRNAYHNESVADQVKKVFEKNKIIEYNHELIQQVDPIYKDPDIEGFLNFRSHFFAPRKYFAGRFFDTFGFNLTFIWFLTAILYITLYYNVLKRILELPERIKFKK
ncbi:MAG: ATP-binding cassette domain-containing protein [Bacteroidales bacterium]|jgi:ABC-type multidrug transport system ATPase subunit|nr:ATP-binding cassette domain-containing protein [Bacteroidales bacterium]